MMDNTASISDTNVQVRSMNPKKFAMWLFMISVSMIFISLSSAYIVKKAEGNWLIVDFPELFNVTSILIVLSSISMQAAYYFTKKDRINEVRISLSVTSLLALGFVVGQYMSWGQLVDQDIFFVGNVAGSFIYVFTGLHIAHLLGGLVFLVIVLINAFKYRVHSRNMSQMSICTTYWHFLGGLWLYLYLFLILNN